jgi:SAM-dependent methyltransferase
LLHYYTLLTESAYVDVLLYSGIFEVISSPSQEELWAGVEARRQRLLTPIPFDIEHRGGPPTTRSINMVAAIHGYTLEGFLDLIGNRNILDIGAGISSLGAQAALLGSKVNLVSIDVPRAYSDPADWAGNKKTGREVIGLGQRLPFADNSFDLIFSTYALPLLACSIEEIDGFINEGLRVLRPGGKFSMSPMHAGGSNNLETNQVIHAHMLGRLEDLHASSEYEVTLGNSNTGYGDVASIEKLER